VDVLDVNVIGQIVDQRAEQIALAAQLLLVAPPVRRVPQHTRQRARAQNFLGQVIVRSLFHQRVRHRFGLAPAQEHHGHRPINLAQSPHPRPGRNIRVSQVKQRHVPAPFLQQLDRPVDASTITHLESAARDRGEHLLHQLRLAGIPLD